MVALPSSQRGDAFEMEFPFIQTNTHSNILMARYVLGNLVDD